MQLEITNLNNRNREPYFKLEISNLRDKETYSQYLEIANHRDVEHFLQLELAILRDKEPYL